MFSSRLLIQKCKPALVFVCLTDDDLKVLYRERLLRMSAVHNCFNFNDDECIMVQLALRIAKMFLESQRLN